VIPVAEWKFFEGTEQRIKHLAGHRQENLLALYRGDALPWDPLELAAREAAVLQEFEYPARVEAAFGREPTPEERRHLELHRRWALGAMFRTHSDLVSLEVPLLERSLRFRPRVRDREVSRAELRTILLTAEERELRETAFDALVPLGEEMEADLTELFRRREMLSRALLEAGYPEAILASRDQDRAEVVGLLDAFERYTRRAYEQARVDVATHLGYHEIEPWDLAFGLARLEGGAEGIAPDDALAAAREQAERWGFPAASLPSGEPASGVPEPAALRRELSDDAAVVFAPGMRGTTGTLASAFGRALAERSGETRRHLLDLVNPVLVEAAGWLFGGRTGESRFRLLELRRLVALAVFENLVYTRSEIEPGRLYGDVVEHALHETGRACRGWPTELPLLLDPLGGVSRILGAMVGAQLAERLGTLFPNWHESPLVGPWLREEIFAAGAGRPWRETVRDATGVDLDMEALSRELGIDYAGPELGDEEGVQDPAVEEYFKDIDLSDLELD